MPVSVSENVHFWEAVKCDAAASRRFQRSKFGYVPVTWFLDPGFVAVFLARVQFACNARRLGALSELVSQLNSILTGADVESSSRVGPGWLMPNPLGVSFWADAGGELTVDTLSGAGHAIGGRLAEGGRPRLGDRVTLEPFSGIQGPLTIGDDVRFVAGGGARRDVAAGTTMGPSQTGVAGKPPPETAARAHAPCDHASFSSLRRDFGADLERTMKQMERMGFDRPRRWRLALRNMFVALLVYRLSHWLDCCGWRFGSRALAGINKLVFKLTIPPESCLGGGVILPHLAGSYILCTAGQDLSAYAQSWVGSTRTSLEMSPRLGDRVFLAAHTATIGVLTIGDDVLVGLKSTVFQDIPAAARVNSPAGVFRRVDPPAEAEDEPGSLLSPPPPPLRDAIGADRARARELRDAGVTISRTARFAVRLYRLSSAAHGAGRLRLARWLWWVNRVLTGADLSPASRIGGGFVVLAPAGLTVHARAGERLFLYGQSVISAGLTADRRLRPVQQGPLLGDDVSIHPHAIISGARTVGRGSTLYAGSVQVSDIPRETRVVPPRIRVMATSWQGSADRGATL